MLLAFCVGRHHIREGLPFRRSKNPNHNDGRRPECLANCERRPVDIAGHQ